MPNESEKIDGRKTPEHLEHLSRIGFQKGRAKTGGRQKVPDVLKERLMDMAPEALNQLEYLITHAEKEAVKLAAIQTVISPFVAKAARKVEVEVNHDLSELHRRVTSGNTELIDITPNDDDYEDDNV